MITCSLHSRWEHPPKVVKLRSEHTVNQYRRIKAQLKAQLVTTHCIKKFIQNLLMGGACPLLVLGYPLIFLENLDNADMYMIPAFLMNSMALIISMACIKETDNIVKSTDIFSIKAYSLRERCYVTILAGSIVVTVAIVLGWMVPYGLYGVTSKGFMLGFTLLGLFITAAISYEKSMQVGLIQLMEKK